MTQSPDLGAAIEAAKKQLDPTHRLPLTRGELAELLTKLGKAFDEALTRTHEAKRVREAVRLAVELEGRMRAMEQEARTLTEEAGAAFKEHFVEPDPVVTPPTTP